MFCPQCGTQLPDTANVCSQCGMPLANRTPGQAQTQAALLPPNPDPTVSAALPQDTPSVAPTTPESTSVPTATAPVPDTPSAAAPAAATGAPIAPSAAAGAPTAPAAAPSVASTMTTPAASVTPAPAAVGTAAATKSKTPLILGIAALALLALLAFGLFSGMRGCAASNNSSPESVVRMLTQSVSTLKIEGMLNSFPDQLIDYSIRSTGSTSRQDFVANTQKIFDEGIDRTQSTFDQLGVKIDIRDLYTNMVGYEVGKSRPAGPTELQDIKDRWDKTIPEFGSSFEEVAYVPVTIKLEGNVEILGQKVPLAELLKMAGTNTSTNLSITTVKINGQWYVLDAGTISPFLS